MKSRVLTIYILGMVGLFVLAGMVAKAGETDQVTCSVTPANISVSVAPATNDYGTMLINSSATSSIITATNDGGITEDFNILGAEAATTTGTWAISSTTPETDIYMHCFTTDVAKATGAATGTDPSATWVGLDDGEYQTLATGIAALGTEEFALDIRTPSAADAQTVYGEQYDTTITVQAVDGT